jgi:nitroreductase
MDFQDVVRRRRMVRAFEDRPLPPDIVDRVLTNAVRAPSAGFSQGWAFLALEDRDQTNAFWDAIRFGDTRHDAVYNAPLIVVCLSHKDGYLDRYAEPDKGWIDRDEARWPAPFWDIDTGFAALLMLLTAVDAGLGALFFGIVPERIDAFRRTFGVPAAYKPIGAVAVGYAAPDTPSASLKRGRRPLETVVHRGRWQAAAAPR